MSYGQLPDGELPGVPEPAQPPPVQPPMWTPPPRWAPPPPQWDQPVPSWEQPSAFAPPPTGWAEAPSARPNVQKQPIPKNYAYRKVTGGELLSAAWSLLSKDRELILLPVLSSIFATIAVLPFLGSSLLLQGTNVTSQGVTGYLLRLLFLFLSLFVATTVAVFFQVALVSALFERLEGGDPTLGSAISAAWRERVRIVQWAFVSAVVGTVLRTIAERGGVGSAIIRILAGVAWAVASLFVVPIIVAEGLGPIDALRRSASIVSHTWGKVLRAGIRFGFTQFLVMLIPFVVMLMGIAAILTKNTTGFVTGGVLIVIALIAMLVIGVFFNALGTALNAVLYRFGAGLPIPGIDAELLANAFKIKT